MNPYVANPDNIPATDRYADVPFYGRYFPRKDDFRVDPQHASVVAPCNGSVRIYPADEGGRDVFALGSVIVKSSHLHSPGNGQHTEIDYPYADANELRAVDIAKGVLKDVRVPEMFFAGKEAFKQQAREILRQLHAVKPTDGRLVRSHIVPDPNILSNGRIHPLEGDILFPNTNNDPDMGFMHNDFTESNCIVDNDRIVGLIDWEMASFFGWKTAGEVHRRIRTPQREHLVNANLSEERLQEIMFWNDLYDDGIPEF
ncbi:kinase-like domain protein [Dichotomopilus funicola]|uniref:Kinase-like domain protein n=1 Tax=Dichotomopilus funicola TaxID=1934379 RepID=A0AAN6ZQD9_9PEZI|nr:kinase-like domain protein [Dichotomopilus funicola]